MFTLHNQKHDQPGDPTDRPHIHGRLAVSRVLGMSAALLALILMGALLLAWPMGRAAAAPVPPSFETLTTNSDDATSITIGNPAGTADDDLLIATVIHGVTLPFFDKVVITPPGGWTPIDYGDCASNECTMGVWYKIASSEPSDYTFLFSHPAELASGAIFSCSFTAAVNGNGGDTETDTVTATAQDDETNAVSESDSAAVTVSVVTIPPSVVNGFFNFGGPSPTATPTPQPTATPLPGQPGTEGGGNGGSGGTGGTVVTATPTPTPTPVVPPPTATTVPAPTATTVPAPTSVPPAPGATPVPAAQPEPSDGGGGAALPAAGIAGIILVVIAIMAAAIYYEVRRRYRLDDLLRG